MKENRHAQVIPANTVAQAAAKIKEAHALLKPYMGTALTAEDRKKLPKMGAKSLDFVGTAFNIAKENPNFLLLGNVPLAEFEKDYTDARELAHLATLQVSLLQEMTDTMMLAGSEALQSANVVYASVRLAKAQKMPGAKALYETLRGKNARTGRRAATKSKEAEQN